jgi:DNA primase
VEAQKEFLLTKQLFILPNMIPDHIKEQVKSAADIVEVVSDYVKLRRAGNGYTGLCPFHNEKSPSFNVSPHLGIFKCFGCGESGDVFSFLMKHDGVSFTEAIRMLGERYGVDVPEEQKPEFDENYRLKEGIFHALSFAGKYYFKQLTQTDEAKKALEYLEKRGFTRDTIKSYGVGFAPDRFDGLLKAAMDTGINEEYLAEAGLVKYGRNGESAYDAFRNRIMFPIFNASGKVIGFGGRVMNAPDGSTLKNTPKYINTAQTKVYNKSEVLYGIHVAKNEIRKYNEAILVEGYTDVISLHQAEVKNVVASSGTALTVEQLRILHRFGENLLMIYDADKAGQNAMSRGLDLALKEGLNVRLLQLPDGEDPDSFIKANGKKGFEKFKDQFAQDFVAFTINKAKSDNRWEDPFHKKTIINEVLRSIAHIPDEITRETFVQRLSELSNLGTRPLFEQLHTQISVLAQSNERAKLSDERFKQRAPVAANRKPVENFEKSLNPDFKKDQNQSLGENSFEDVPFPDDEFQHRGSNLAASPYQNEQQATHAFPTEVNRKSPDNQVKTPNRKPPYERELLRLMLMQMHPMVEYVGSQCNEDHFEDAEYKLLFADLVQRYNEGLPISIEVYMERESPFPEITGEIVFDRYSTSSRTKEKVGKKINRDGNPFRTAKGELRTLKMYYLDRVKNKFLQLYMEAGDDVEKDKIQKLLMDVSRHRLRFENENLDQLFPDPDKV